MKIKEVHIVRKLALLFLAFAMLSSTVACNFPQHSEKKVVAAEKQKQENSKDSKTYISKDLVAHVGTHISFNPNKDICLLKLELFFVEVIIKNRVLLASTVSHYFETLFTNIIAPNAP